MTSIEIPYSIAAALPSLSVLDITNDVQHALATSEYESGIALLSPRGERVFVRVNERESGIFEDFEALLARLVPYDQAEREDEGKKRVSRDRRNSARGNAFRNGQTTPPYIPIRVLESIRT